MVISPQAPFTWTLSHLCLKWHWYFWRVQVSYCNRHFLCLWLSNVCFMIRFRLGTFGQNIIAMIPKKDLRIRRHMLSQVTDLPVFSKGKFFPSFLIRTYLRGILWHSTKSPLFLKLVPTGVSIQWNLVWICYYSDCC